MLHFFRTASKTWVFKLLFGLLIVSFGVWGIGDVSFGGSGNRVATIGDAEVSVDDYSRALQREMQATSQRVGRRITVDEANSAGLPQILLARLVRDAALNNEAAILGVSADDAAVRMAIMESPSFRGLDGKFDDAQYKFVVDRLGFRPEAFEADMRSSIARDLITYAVAGGAVPAPGLAERTLARQLEERSFELIRLRPEDAAAPEAPDDAALTAWIDANRGDFMRPETRAVAWFAIDPVALIDSVTVDEEELRAAYASHTETYDIPEQREVDQLSFPDVAAANAAKARVEKGEATFEALVAERGLSLDDVARGAVARSDLAENVGDAAFGLAAPGVAGPVSSSFGPSLINVRSIAPARVVPFEDAAAELRTDIARDLAQEQAVTLAERAADVLASGASLEGVAKELGLTVRTAPALTAAGDAAAGPFGGDPAFVAEVFEAAPGEARDLIETTAGGWVLVRIDAVKDAAPMSFEDARDAAAAAWTRAARIDALAASAKTALDDLATGTSMADIAARFGKTANNVGPVRRDGAGAAIDPALLADLFAAPATGAAMARTAAGVTFGAVTAITPADLTAPQNAALLARWQEQLGGSMADDLYAYYAAALQAQAGATINQAAMDLVVNGLR
jgi:peptidyl-prolyl cis-trans isomerase D